MHLIIRPTHSRWLKPCLKKVHTREHAVTRMHSNARYHGSGAMFLEADFREDLRGQRGRGQEGRKKEEREAEKGGGEPVEKDVTGWTE